MTNEKIEGSIKNLGGKDVDSKNKEKKNNFR